MLKTVIAVLTAASKFLATGLELAISGAVGAVLGLAVGPKSVIPAWIAVGTAFLFAGLLLLVRFLVTDVEGDDRKASVADVRAIVQAEVSTIRDDKLSEDQIRAIAAETARLLHAQAIEPPPGKRHGSCRRGRRG